MISFLSLFGSLLGCGEKETDADTCRLHTDCESGVCGDDGFCVDPTGEPSSENDTSEDSGDTDDTDTEDTGDSLCVPNHDGVIERDEFPLEVGISVNFLLGLDTPVDLSGNSWDLSGTMNQDSTAVVTPTPPSEFWFGENAPDSTYVTVLSYANETYGVFTLTDDALYLDGIASFEEGLFSTQLGFDPPVPMLQFPIQEGDSWEVETTVSGLFNGSWTTYLETYTAQIDKAGTLTTPMGEFPVLRLNTGVDRWIGLLNTKNRSMGFVAECYGVVATVSSELDETASEFTQASQVLRITP